MEENFVDIEGYWNMYQISDLGSIKSLRYNKILKPRKVGKFLAVDLCIDRVHKQLYIHRLVAKHFVANDDIWTKNEVKHKDDDTLNNAATNLEWISSSKRITEMIQKNSEDPNGYVKMTNKEVEELRNNHKDTATSSLVGLYRVGPGYLSAVRSGKRRKTT